MENVLHRKHYEKKKFEKEIFQLDKRLQSSLKNVSYHSHQIDIVVKSQKGIKNNSSKTRRKTDKAQNLSR